MKNSIIVLKNFIPFILLLLLVSYSCSKDTTEAEDQEVATTVEDETETNEEKEQEEDEEMEEESTCSDPLNFIFNEKDGLILVEFEDAEFSDEWKLKTDGDSFTGAGYMVWEGTQSLGNPGNGKTNFTLKIQNPGTYQFIWFSAVKTGNNGTEHNDTWLRFNDADDFYGEKNQGASIVYPNGSGKTPNPAGASKDGWFKIYRSGNDLDFKWQSRTSDNDAHEIFVKFDEPGNYVMEVSARSTGHAIDKFVLFKDDITKNDATSSAEFSTISCN